MTTTVSWPECRVILTGGAGFLGRNIHRALLARGVIPRNIVVVRRDQFDLTRAQDVDRLYAASGSPGSEMVIHCAGLVGGLGANAARPAEFFYQNISMALNLIEGARRTGLNDRGGKFVMVGSMTSYPAGGRSPFREDDLFNGYPEASSAPYGIAKLAALEMLRAYHTQHGLKSAYVVPVNLYGPGDNLKPGSSHFVGALVDRCVNSHIRAEPRMVCWGTGRPSREFLYVEDGAEGVIRAAEVMDAPVPINLSPGVEYSIREVVDLIVRLVGYRGEVVWDAEKPDGQARRCLDPRRAKELLGWGARVSLEEGLKRTIEWRLALGTQGDGAPY